VALNVFDQLSAAWSGGRFWIADCGDGLRAALARDHIPFVERDDSIWIYGYAAAFGGA